MEQREKKLKCELYNDHFQNFKTYNIPKAQLVLCDIPFNIGKNAYGSNPVWYIGGDNKNGESELAGKEFFDTDKDFRIMEYMHFCSKMLIKEPKERGKAPCMIVFCAFEQIPYLCEKAKEYGFNGSQHLTFIKDYSPQVLKANMRIVGATEHAMLFYRDKLPKFNNNGKMIFDWFKWEGDIKGGYPKIHPTQKPVSLLKKLIEIYTDKGDTVIDPCAGSGSTLRAAAELGRNAYGFEIKKDFYKEAKEKMLTNITIQEDMFSSMFQEMKGEQEEMF